MFKKLILTTLCLLAFPVLLQRSADPGTKQNRSSQFVVLAGQTQGGEWCGCGTSGCMCDPGEQPGGNATVANQTAPQSTDQTVSQTDGMDMIPAVAAVIMLTLLLLIRIR